jgi:hypothetical protein
MIFHSANNLRKRKRKKKKKKKRKKKKKKKKKKKNKRGHKRNSIEPHAITMIWSIPFKHGQVLLN